jgi:ABC-2 type transport system permease protein
MNTYVWLVKREFWENRAIWIIPASIGALLTLASLFGTVEATFFDSPERTRSMAGTMFLAFGALFFAAMSLYSFWYLLDCLYTDRRDRSILFWKSLPISDTATVLSKVFVGLVAIPMVYFAAADAAILLAAFVLSVRAHSLPANVLWQPDVWLQLQAIWIYVIVTTAIWYLPVTGWLLVISAWAKRAVMLWSILPPLAVILAERLFLGTHVCLRMIGDRLVGYASRAFNYPAHGAHWADEMSGNQSFEQATAWRMLDPWGFLSSPATWIGALIGGALIAAAIQLRLRKGDC